MWVLLDTLHQVNVLTRPEHDPSPALRSPEICGGSGFLDSGIS
jgi:hypothetical protein